MKDKGIDMLEKRVLKKDRAKRHRETVSGATSISPLLTYKTRSFDGSAVVCM